MGGNVEKGSRESSSNSKRQIALKTCLKFYLHFLIKLSAFWIYMCGEIKFKIFKILWLLLGVISHF